MCATSIGSTRSHRPVAGERKSGTPGHRDAGAGQRDRGARVTQKTREPGELGCLAPLELLPSHRHLNETNRILRESAVFRKAGEG